MNCYLIPREPLTLIDPGPLTEEAWDALRAGLDSAGFEVADIERVLLTHGHHDHYGLAERVTRASGARIFGGRLDRRQFRMERNGRHLLDEMSRADFSLIHRLTVVAAVAAFDRLAEPLQAWDELSGGEVLSGDGYSIVVRSVPGHTPGSLTFEIPEASVLLTGDTVLKRITPNAVVVEDPERPGEAFRSVTRYFESLDALEGTNGGSRLLTGHGEPIADFDAHRRGLRRRYRLRKEQIERVLEGDPKTVRQLVAALFPTVKTINIFLAYSEVVGFLMYLEDLGRVEKVRGTLKDRYRLVP